MWLRVNMRKYEGTVMVHVEWLSSMTQDERWLKNYHEVMEYMETHKRNLSKYDLEIRHLYTWVKHNRKVMNKGELKPDRQAKFQDILALCEQNRRKNQWE